MFLSKALGTVASFEDGLLVGEVLDAEDPLALDYIDTGWRRRVNVGPVA